MTDKIKIEMPEWLEYWTADEVAECLYPGGCETLYGKLWEFVCEAEEAGTATPLGGDGSNGTVETPDGRLDPANTDKGPHWWSRLTSAEQQMIIDAYKAEYPTRGEK